MSDITAQERQYLKGKYIDADPVAGVDDHVNAILDGEWIGANAVGYGAPNNWLVCDPDRNPTLYQKVRSAHFDFQMAKADGAFTYETENPDYTYDPDAPDSAVTLIHYVGHPKVGVCRRQPREVVDWLFGHTKAVGPERGPNYWVGLLQLYSEVYDLWLTDDCQLNLADDCGGNTIMFPLSFGGVVHVFRGCLPCQAQGAETAEINFRFSEIAAHERAAAAPLPAWARRAPWWLRLRAAIRRRFRRRR